MEFKPCGVYNGFQLVEKRKIEEIKASGFVFVHIKSGANLMYLQCDDDNKVFSITFKTPPPDNTGIPHILEHSVLCGSKKYPVKEPFVELAKGSLSTFLNALTFPDKTMYPVASRNDKDFYNLMDVYLDAVFRPRIYDNPEIFMQEGWHYELDSSDSKIQYRGVVYNEMKGAFSTPEELLLRKIPQSLFPDTPYGFDSGGDPDFIPELTFERFLSFHRNYYHPSNSYIFFYGNGNIEEHLRFLDENYLNEYEKIEVDSMLRIQPQFSEEVEKEVPYPILPHEDEKDKTFLSLNFVVDRATNPEFYLSFGILEYMLLETPAAPLKKALMDARIGKDVFGQFERDIFQPVFSIVVKNSNVDRKEDFKEIVFNNLDRLVKDGMDKNIIEAAINIHEFKLREADFRGFPKGVVYCWTIMGSWLYGGDPFVHLQYEKNLKKVKTALKTNYFERLIEKFLIKNSHRSLLILVPRKNLAEKKAKELEARLLEYRQKLKKEELECLVNNTHSLREGQARADPPELVAKIPHLSLKDLNPEAEKLPLEELEEKGVKVLFHPVFTGGIVYFNLFFDTSCVPQEDIPYLTLLARLLGKVSTENYSYSDLSNRIDINTGGIHFSARTFSDKEDDALYFPKLMVRSKALVAKIGELHRLLSEIAGRTRYDEKDRLREIIQEARSRIEMGIYELGHFVATGRLLSYFSPAGRYSELLDGLSFYHFITGLEREFDKKFDEIFVKLKEVSSKVFNRKGLIVSVTADRGDYRHFRESFSSLLEVMDDKDFSVPGYQFKPAVKNEGLLTPGEVQYVAKGFNFRALGYKYNGCLDVLGRIASLDYLWNRIRVQGGAYGSFARFGRDGTMYFCSYRDPNLRETLRVYDDAANFFRRFSATKREIDKYIIGTISKLDHPLTPSMKGEIATERYIRNISHFDVQKAREEVLGTQLKHIRDYADMIGEAMGKNLYCVLGNESKIKENRELFEALVNVF